MTITMKLFHDFSINSYLLMLYSKFKIRNIFNTKKKYEPKNSLTILEDPLRDNLDRVGATYSCRIFIEYDFVNN
ncbi:unnamed protein product [Pneumocystis jirovecii]|uniref:Uncharacterized protein n=1 Tax=Pneumocystis jirovecii TaxID=42068 RepID=L0P6T6_PNEJI|nr:unnamed protein product [Pneumocystis jirovecii]